MATVETQIWLALEARVKTLPMMPMPIHWPGMDYTPGAVDFLDVADIYIAPRRMFINKNVNDRSGSIIISYVGEIGQPSAYYRERGGIIANHFNSTIGLRYQTVCLSLMSDGGNSAEVQAGYRDGGWYRVPVVIPWRTFA